jgi:hypothetical protein
MQIRAANCFESFPLLVFKTRQTAKLGHWKMRGVGKGLCSILNRMLNPRFGISLRRFIEAWNAL